MVIRQIGRSRKTSSAAVYWPGVVAVLLVLIQSGCGDATASKASGTHQETGAVANQRVASTDKEKPLPNGGVKKAKKSLFGTELEEIPPETKSRVVNHSRFSDVAAACAIDFTYQNGKQGKALMVEATGGGGGWGDFDRDGKWDLYLVQGGDPSRTATPDQPIDRVFQNLGEDHFRDITAQCRIDEHGYGQGLAIGDFDADGFDDIFVTNVGRNVLYHNNGDGTFSEYESELFGKESLWSTSAAWGDIDRDGDLDLYVCRYCIYDPLHPKICHYKDGRVGICHPKDVEPCPDECYLNEGDGTFKPVAKERGLFGQNNRGLGVVIADFNNDEWPDIFVANDTTENFLFINLHNGKFEEQAQLLGCAVNINGNAQANMGIAVGDYDRNGFLDLYITHYHKEWNTLYQNLGPNGFHDVTASAQLTLPTMDKLGWGTVMADFDQDGFDELFAVNGHLDDLTSDGIDYEMTAQLFGYNGRTWDDCSQTAGAFFKRKCLARGVATCDYDDDGDLDILVVPQNSRTALLKNESQRGHWLKLSFIGSGNNRAGIGTRVTLTSQKYQIMQELAGGTSYCASIQPVLLFGLGDDAQPCDLEIRWPTGQVQRLSGVRPDQSLVIREPEGQVAAQP